MKLSKKTTMLFFGAAIVTSAAVLAQQGAFTATGTRCEDVTWSAEALRTYPSIATACRDVLQRDGQYFVRFEAEVRNVADRGRQITVDFVDGDRLTLAPPENLSITINGRPTEPRNLRPGDQLRFYIPQDQLTATFFAGAPETAEPQQVPIAPVVADAQLAAAPVGGAVLPRTAGSLPLVGALGMILVAVGAGLTVRRRVRGLH